MPSKLALHCHRAGADIDAAMRSAPWAAVKALDTTQPLVTARDAGVPIRILRLYGIEGLDAPAAVARWLSMDLGAVTHVQLVCETRCADVAWQQSVIDGLRSGGYRGRFLVGGWAVGNPETIVDTPDGPHFPELEPTYPLLRLPYVDLALDQYAGILPDDPRWPQWAPYTAQRHRLILDDLRRQGIDCDVITCESSGDNATPVLTGGGWRTRGWTAEQLLGLLTTLDKGDQQDARMPARCVYTLGAPSDWAPYDVAPILDQLAAYVRSQAGGPNVLRGIDVSDAQPGTDWQAVKASGVQFAVVKATEGVGWPPDARDASSQFRRDWAAAGAAGLVRVAYHFARPDLGNQDHDEADWFTSIVGPLLGPGDGVALDLELGDGDLSGWASGWLRFVAQMTATTPLLYSYTSFLPAHGLTAGACGNPPLWLADYRDWAPTVPDGWPGYLLWQHTSRASVPGVATLCDEDYLYGTLDDLQRLGRRMLMDDLFEMQWKSRKADVALNPNAALFKDWLDRRRRGDYSLGVPLTEEFPHGAGVCQVMTNAIGTWDATNGVKWV